MAALFVSGPHLARVIFYIDGFNLYHGAVKETAYKWLDLSELCRRLRPQDEIVFVRYFTSYVKGAAPGQRQATFLQALATKPLIRTQIGKFTNKPVKCGVSNCQHAGPRDYTVIVEKRTDVNIGAHMLADAGKDRCDVLALLSGDTDLVPAVSLVRAEYPEKYIQVYVPVRPGTDPEKERRSDELRKSAHRGGFISEHLLKECQFSDPVLDAKGREIRKPAAW